MRIVAHNGARILGGAERATVMLMAGLQSRGHDVHLFCNDEIVATHARESSIPAGICVLGGDLSVLSALRFSSALHRRSPDALIVGTWKKLFLAAWAGKRAQVHRVVARVGLESDTARSRKYEVALRRWTDAVVVNSARMVEPFASLKGFGADRVHLIHNGVTAPRRRAVPGELRRQLGIPADARVIGTIARLASQKRIDRLLRAHALLGASVHCVIAGNGREKRMLEQTVKQLGTTERVHFLGHREDKGDVLDAIDVFAITSDQEGLSNAMLEAMAFGIPVVSTPVSGTMESLGSDGSRTAPGVVTSFEETDIASELRALLDDSARLAKMGDAARARAKASFSIESMLDRWEAVLGA